jgi:8-oxo-dGTP pyrophosphatase MutT (NUDIX family)
MIDSRHALIAALISYTTTFFEEKQFKNRIINLLQDSRCYYRDHLPGHITGSAWIVDESKQFTLLTHHAKLNKWLQPGGHADVDEDIAQVALREAVEETGVKNFNYLSNDIFDIDIHTIPARNNFPEHLHFDIRFILQAKKEEALIITAESIDLKWIPLKALEKYTSNASLFRMRNKVLS